jgi:hypothetical protein
MTSLTGEVILHEMFLQLGWGLRVIFATGLQAVLVLGGFLVVLIPLVLVLEFAMARLAPNMHLGGSQMSIQFTLAVEGEETGHGHASKSMAGAEVVQEVVVEAPLVVESTETDIARDFVSERVVDMVLQAVAILKHTLTEVAVVVVTHLLLDVHLHGGLVWQVNIADAAPVFPSVWRLVGINWGVSRSICEGNFSGKSYVAIVCRNGQFVFRADAECRNLSSLLPRTIDHLPCIVLYSWRWLAESLASDHLRRFR